MKKNIIKVGSSLAMTFDKLILEITGFIEDDKLDVQCSKGKMIIKKK